MNPPTIERQILLGVPEHQVVLSFTNDADAAKFEEFWNNEGEQTFLSVIDQYGD